MFQSGSKCAGKRNSHQGRRWQIQNQLDKSTDDITPQSTLRYNIYVKDQSGKIYTYAPADITTGRLKAGVPTLLYKNEIVLDFPATATSYTIGVQAVDQANVTSTFATTTVSIETGNRMVPENKINAFGIGEQIKIMNNNSSNVNFSVISTSGKIIYTGICNGETTLVVPPKICPGRVCCKICNTREYLPKESFGVLNRSGF